MRREVTCSTAGGWQWHQSRPGLAVGIRFVWFFSWEEAPVLSTAKRGDEGPGQEAAAALAPGPPGEGPLGGMAMEGTPGEAGGFSPGSRDPSPGASSSRRGRGAGRAGTARPAGGATALYIAKRLGTDLPIAGSCRRACPPPLPLPLPFPSPRGSSFSHRSPPSSEEEEEGEGRI